jgi:hypothetical protein
VAPALPYALPSGLLALVPPPYAPAPEPFAPFRPPCVPVAVARSGVVFDALVLRVLIGVTRAVLPSPFDIMMRCMFVSVPAEKYAASASGRWILRTRCGVIARTISVTFRLAME